MAVAGRQFPEQLEPIAKRRSTEGRAAGALELLDERVDWSWVDSREYLVDLSFSDPFAPWKLKTAQKDMRRV